MSNYYLLMKGDFAYNKSYSNGFPLGTVKRLDKYDQGALSSLYIVFRPKKVNTDFLSIYYDTNKWHREVMKLSAEGARNHGLLNIPVNSFFEKNIIIPIHEKEQLEIAKFLKRLEKIIALHQRKINILEALKKAYLNRIFPIISENIPRIRFNGINEEWERYKLGDLGSVAMNRRIFKDETSSNGEIPFYKIGTFGKKANAFITREKFEEYKHKYPYPQVGDTLISASGSIGRTVVYKGEEAYYQDSNIVWLKHDGNIDNTFLNQFYNIIKWNGVEGTTIKRLYNKNILNTEITLPSLIEQKEIGRFLNILDSITEFHQSKLNALKKLKKVYLNKMFI
ncbi:MAG TPA: restriction endonuclease subunit S [Jeotgalicoccus sp.]|nr:restriction endonuclease subunit S [Jeotgalicoccus sp.]